MRGGGGRRWVHLVRKKDKYEENYEEDEDR